EGILTARLQLDPLLSEFRTVVIDEFHERSIHADVAIALARQAWRARDDLRIVVMSAALDAAAGASCLRGCPVIQGAGKLHPVTVSYAPAQPIAAAVADVMRVTDGGVLCFLPGAGEIRRAIEELQTAGVAADAEVLALHGSLDGEAQDAALRPSTRRRIVVA